MEENTEERASRTEVGVVLKHAFPAMVAEKNRGCWGARNQDIHELGADFTDSQKSDDGTSEADTSQEPRSQEKQRQQVGEY